MTEGRSGDVSGAGPSPLAEEPRKATAGARHLEAVARPSRKDRLVDLAREIGATVIESAGATVIVIAADAAPERLSVDDVARIASCTPRRVREAIRTGDLPASELGERALSVRREDALAWLDRHPARVRSADVARDPTDEHDDADEDDDLDDRIARIGGRR